MKYMKVIEDNDIGDNESFIYFLHEEWNFRKDKFIELCESIIEITKYDLSQSNISVIDRHIASRISHIHEYILGILLCESLFYDMKSFPTYEDRLEYVATLNKVVSYYFKGLIINESIEDQLDKNLNTFKSK
ncbi:hypothetical protein [Romboutsia lituseburensis]|uniref:hypothetical protein n=1 Tax=Romboutsia lituseburensis TaxID=1537 RepID=UPI00215ACC76|nr:hypothetical protein [Romboutsia lituseburensis]MCR8747178.1 hypothetical protein [Romboutsia lituseburensis]